MSGLEFAIKINGIKKKKYILYQRYLYFGEGEVARFGQGQGFSERGKCR